MDKKTLKISSDRYSDLVFYTKMLCKILLSLCLLACDMLYCEDGNLATIAPPRPTTVEERTTATTEFTSTSEAIEAVHPYLVIVKRSGQHLKGTLISPKCVLTKYDEHAETDVVHNIKVEFAGDEDGDGDDATFKVLKTITFDRHGVKLEILVVKVTPPVDKTQTIALDLEQGVDVGDKLTIITGYMEKFTLPVAPYPPDHVSGMFNEPNMYFVGDNTEKDWIEFYGSPAVLRNKQVGVGKEYFGNFDVKYFQYQRLNSTLAAEFLRKTIDKECL